MRISLRIPWRFGKSGSIVASRSRSLIPRLAGPAGMCQAPQEETALPPVAQCVALNWLAGGHIEGLMGWPLLREAMVEVSEATREKIRYAAALSAITQSPLVEAAVDEYLARHADELGEGIARARAALRLGDDAAVTHTLVAHDKPGAHAAFNTPASLAGAPCDRSMGDEVVVPYSLPLDSDRFLRRECPTCERECKWYSAADGEAAEKIPDGDYFCPYCAIQALPTAWFTQAQVALPRGLLKSEVAGPAIEKFAESLKDIGRRSGGFLKVEGGNHRRPARPDPLTETDDMRRVDFGCHPDEPVKVLDDWCGAVHCLIRGEGAAARTGSGGNGG